MRLRSAALPPRICPTGSDPNPDPQRINLVLSDEVVLLQRGHKERARVSEEKVPV
jgi:hypothetical protein